YKYLGNVAAEMRLPITVPNPAHSQFIPRSSADPVDETQALTPGRARQLLGMPDGESVLDYRDRAILKFFLYAGARLATSCMLQGYLARLPGALKEQEFPDGTKKVVCIYTPHSLRATVATLLLDSGIDISSVRDLLGHRHVTTTQIYDKRRRGTAESASHQVPL